jgi:hypothetical protein
MDKGDERSCLEAYVLGNTFISLIKNKEFI